MREHHWTFVTRIGKVGRAVAHNFKGILSVYTRTRRFIKLEQINFLPDFFFYFLKNRVSIHIPLSIVFNEELIYERTQYILHVTPRDGSATLGFAAQNHPRLPRSATVNNYISGFFYNFKIN